MGQWFAQPDHTGISSAALYGVETQHAPRAAVRESAAYGAAAVADDPTTRQVLGLLRRTLDSLPE